MPGLRVRVIAIICEEWAKGEELEIPLHAATISERLQKDNVSTSEAEVQQELRHLVDHGLITLAPEPPSGGPGATTVVGSVSPELCR
jgi:hypothetical protein